MSIDENKAVLERYVAALRAADADAHLATRIQPLDQLRNPDAWGENDRLRADASRILVDASLAAAVSVYVQPTVAFVYPPDGPTTEETPVTDVLPILESPVAAEREAARFAQAAGWRPFHLRRETAGGANVGDADSQYGHSSRCG